MYTLKIVNFTKNFHNATLIQEGFETFHEAYMFLHEISRDLYFRACCRPDFGDTYQFTIEGPYLAYEQYGYCSGCFRGMDRSVLAVRYSGWKPGYPYIGSEEEIRYTTATPCFCDTGGFAVSAEPFSVKHVSDDVDEYNDAGITFVDCNGPDVEGPAGIGGIVSDNWRMKDITIADAFYVECYKLMAPLQAPLTQIPWFIQEIDFVDHRVYPTSVGVVPEFNWEQFMETWKQCTLDYTTFLLEKERRGSPLYKWAAKTKALIGAEN